MYFWQLKKLIKELVKIGQTKNLNCGKRGHGVSVVSGMWGLGGREFESFITDDR